MHSHQPTGSGPVRPEFRQTSQAIVRGQTFDQLRDGDFAFAHQQLHAGFGSHAAKAGLPIRWRRGELQVANQAPIR